MSACKFDEAIASESENGDHLFNIKKFTKSKQNWHKKK